MDKSGGQSPPPPRPTTSAEASREMRANMNAVVVKDISSNGTLANLAHEGNASGINIGNYGVAEPSSTPVTDTTVAPDSAPAKSQARDLANALVRVITDATVSPGPTTADEDPQSAKLKNSIEILSKLAGIKRTQSQSTCANDQDLQRQLEEAPAVKKLKLQVANLLYIAETQHTLIKNLLKRNGDTDAKLANLEAICGKTKSHKTNIRNILKTRSSGAASSDEVASSSPVNSRIPEPLPAPVVTTTTTEHISDDGEPSLNKVGAKSRQKCSRSRS